VRGQRRGAAREAREHRTGLRRLINRTQPLLPLHLSGRPAEATLALLIESQRLEELALAEIRPERVGDVDLRVGDLPEEEVAEAHLAAGPDEQVGIRDARGAEVAADDGRGDLLGAQLAAAHATGDGTRRARPRCCAQRPLPSMMTATCRGMREGSSSTIRRP